MGPSLPPASLQLDLAPLVAAAAVPVVSAAAAAVRAAVSRGVVFGRRRRRRPTHPSGQFICRHRRFLRDAEGEAGAPIPGVSPSSV